MQTIANAMKSNSVQISQGHAKKKKLYGLQLHIFTLIPWKRERALKGRRARRVRIVLKAWMFAAPRKLATRLTTETWWTRITLAFTRDNR